MRYLFLVLNSFLSVVINNAVSPRIPIFGVQMDFILLGLAGVIFFEDSLSDIWYSMICIFAMDVFFARAYGFYALQYISACLTFYLITSGRKKELWIFIAGLSAAYLIREITGVVGCFLSDNPVNLWSRLIHVTIKGIFLHALLGCILYFLYKKAYDMRLLKHASREIDSYV